VLSKNLLIGHRIVAGFAVPLIALIVIGFFSLKNLDQMQREASLVAHTGDVLTEVRGMTAAVSRIESTGRGYVISGEDVLKADLEQYRGDAIASLKRLRVLMLDYPAQLRRLDQLDTLVAQRGQLSRDLVVARDSGAVRADAQFAALVRQGQNVS
jgi:CHASE3 domain sensor protein